MITISKKFFCAIEAMLIIAAEANGEPTSSKAIAERLGVAPRYFEQMMQKLVRAGILRGMRGPKGGYVLARERRRITLEDIRKVLDEGDANPMPASIISREVLYPIAQNIRGSIADRLTTITLADLCQEMEDKNITPLAKKAQAEAKKRIDYTI